MKKLFHILSSSAFIVVCVLFFMPFVSLECGNRKLVTVSGMELVTGFTMQVPALDERRDAAVRRTDPNMFAVIALVFGVIGIALPHAMKGKPNLPPVVVTIAVIVLLALIALQIDLNARLGEREKNLLVVLGYEAAYWLCIFISIAVGVLAFVVKGRDRAGPVSAPAGDIEGRTE